MEKQVETIEAMFQKTESDLYYLSKKLECEFENSHHAAEGSNPVKMLERLGEIKKEYAKIVQEAAAIQEAQREAMQYFQSQLVTACTVLEKLQHQSGSETPDSPEAQAELEALLGTLMEKQAPSTSCPAESEAGQSKPQT